MNLFSFYLVSYSRCIETAWCHEWSNTKEAGGSGNGGKLIGNTDLAIFMSASDSAPESSKGVTDGAARKDRTLAEFLLMLDDFKPLVSL